VDRPGSMKQYWDDLEWIKNFRMTRQTLFESSETLRPFLMRKDTVMCSALPVEERVAIGVYFLASLSCYHTIALVFQKGTSTVASIVVEVCLAIEHTMLRKEVRISDFSKYSHNCLLPLACTFLLMRYSSYTFNFYVRYYDSNDLETGVPPLLGGN
ncbi:hypothetical protein JRQ81_014581, partial [Phrynocephalus forsythii]